MARSKINLTPDQVDMVRKLSYLGLGKEKIAWCLGISKRTLDARMDDQKGLREEWESGKGKKATFVLDQLHKKIEQGNLGAIIFWLKCQEGWKESDRLEITGRDGGPVETKKAQEMTDEEILSRVQQIAGDRWKGQRN